MASRDRHPIDAIANGTRGRVIPLPSPPSTVSSADHPEDPPSVPPAHSPPDEQPLRTTPSKGKKKKKSQRQRAHLTTPSQPSFAQSAALSPRPIQDLLVERAYLVSSLASQGMRAANLVYRLSAAEQAAAAAAAAASDEDGPDVVVAGGRRRLRKHMALLRSKIAAAAEQEKAIVVRLGELYVETQSRERWEMARMRAQADSMFQLAPQETGYFMLAGGGGGGGDIRPGLLDVSISTGLSPESPEFVPRWEWPRGVNPWPMPDVPVPQE